MAETYCGKSCAACISREAQSCPGCKTGPGARIQGDCEIARCCRDKGHETCETCSTSVHCGSYRGRGNMPEYRQKRQAAEQAKAESIARQAPVLGKWLWILFWLVIPAILAGLISGDTVAEWSPGLYMFGLVLGIACDLARGGVLLRLSSEEEMYRKAGMFSMVAVALSVPAIFLTQAPMLSFLISAALLIVGIAAKYYEYQAHSSAVSNVDTGRAARWTLLWKWYLGTMLTLAGSLILMLMIPTLGAIVMIVATIVLLIVRIAESVMLYYTAKCFRDHPAA